MALHMRLFLTLRDQIQRGALAAGTRLPSELALTGQYGVSRITVRRALRELAEQGYIERLHGVGTFVRARMTVPPKPITMSIADAARQTTFDSTLELLDFGKREPPPAVAALLGEPAPAIYARRLRRRKSNGEALYLWDTWLPVRLSSRVTREALETRTLADILDESGVETARVIQDFSAELASPDKAALLGAAVGSALIRTTRIALDKSGGLIEHGTIYLRADKSRWLMDLEVDSGGTTPMGYIAHDVPQPEG
jgi:GntR family transcriptional regulator